MRIVLLMMASSAAASGWAQEDDFDSLLGDAATEAETPPEPSPSAAASSGDPPSSASAAGGEQTAASAGAEPPLAVVPVRPNQDESAAAGRPKDRARVVEEIVVTAQKRAEGLQEVPISVSAFDGKFLQDFAIGDFRDLSLFVPNARIDPNGSLPQISIRGFNAHPVNRAFEQPVSLIVDGVAYGSSVYFQTALFDLERVEILRGPQGTLFGKNSTAGAFNMVTRSGDVEAFDGLLIAQAGELGRQRVEAGIGGPIIDGVMSFRIAGLWDQRDGLLTNTSAEVDPRANREMNAREREAMRLKLGWPDVYGTNLALSYERTEVRLTGFGAELYKVSPKLLDLYRAYDAGFDGVAGNYVGSMNAPEFTAISGDSYVINADRDFGGWDIAGVAGYSKLRYASVLDGDFGPQPLLLVENRDDHPQSTVELRANSPELRGWFGLEQLAGAPLGQSRLTAGVFAQKRQIRNGLARLQIDPTAAGQFSAANRSPNPPPAPPPGSMPPNDPADDEIVTIFFAQTVESKAGFAQFEWTFIEPLTLQLGARYTLEDKSAAWESIFEQGSGALARAALGRQEFTDRRARAEKKVTPKALLKYDISPDANLYLGWVKGFRSGGFNEFASTPADLEYAEESVRSWEAGSKLKLLDGAAVLNLGLFWMTLEDFQVLTQDPSNATLRVVNAGKARARGMELDGVWLPTHWLNLQAAVGFNDTEFLEFPYGTCTADNPDTDGDGDARCDLKGEPLDFAPRLTVSFNPRLVWLLPIADLEATAGVTGLYQGEHFQDLAVRDDRVKQEAATRWNASLGIGGADGSWSFRLVGDNLTDERVSVFRSDAPLSTGTFYQTLEPPRLVFGELQWRF